MGKETMKAWVVRKWCKPGEMEFEEVPIPRPGPGQILVKVEAAALNFLDTLMIQGLYQRKPPLPFTPGVEIAGEVVESGAGSRFRSGERVMGMAPYGGYAEYAVVDEVEAVAMPDFIPAEHGAAMQIVYPTAFVGLRHGARLSPGETVLVHAGAGGVGLAAIQLAKHWGATVIATAGGPEKTAICRQYGADHVVDYIDDNWVEKVNGLTSGRGVDIVCDPVGGAVTEASLKCLAWLGRLLVLGFSGGVIPSIPANRLLLKSASAIGILWGDRRLKEPELGREVFSSLFAMYRQGEIKPVVSRQYPFSQAPQALLHLAGRRTYGKVVLIP